MEQKMPRHICFLKNKKTKKRFQLVIFDKRSDGKSSILLYKRFENLDEAVAKRDEWLSENDPARLEKVREKDRLEEEKVAQAVQN